MNERSNCFDVKSYISQYETLFQLKTVILDNKNTAAPIPIPKNKSFEIVCTDESGESKAQVKLIEG